MPRSRIAALLVVLASVGIVLWWAMARFTERPSVQVSAVDKRPAAPDKGSARRTGKSGPGGVIAVEAATARGARTSSDVRAIGSLRSDESVLITSEVAGRIAEINFKEGGATQAGAVLVKLDVALAEAEVADAKARYELAEANNQRAKQLSRTGSVTDKAIDEATANFEIARAALELQRVKLARHTLKAPFAGQLGMRQVSVGGFVGAGTAIVNLEKIDVLKVDFKLPELLLSSVSIGQVVEVSVDAIPGRTFTGEIYAIDPQVDVNGRALALRARLANPDLVLRPGLFARITVKGAQARQVVLAPESSIVPRGGEAFVFRIENGKAVEAKVRLGERRGTEVEIVEGLAPDTRVVTAGQLKLRDGAAVEVVEAAPVPGTRKGGT